MVENNKENKEFNKNWLLVVLVGLIVVVFVIIAVYYFYTVKTGQPIVANDNSQQKVADKSPISSLVPSDAKDPEDFLKKVKEKSAEVQKNYDASLTEFARKRWENIFKKQNNLESIDWQNSLKFLSQEIQKTDDQSTLFKINYKIIQGETEVSNEDYYYLTISSEKKKELGLSNLSSNAFISEEDILKNLNRENFVKIGKINK